MFGFGFDLVQDHAIEDHDRAEHPLLAPPAQRGVGRLLIDAV